MPVQQPRPWHPAGDALGLACTQGALLRLQISGMFYFLPPEGIPLTWARLRRFFFFIEESTQKSGPNRAEGPGTESLSTGPPAPRETEVQRKAVLAREAAGKCASMDRGAPQSADVGAPRSAGSGSLSKHWASLHQPGYINETPHLTYRVSGSIVHLSRSTERAIDITVDTYAHTQTGEKEKGQRPLGSCYGLTCVVPKMPEA